MISGNISASSARAQMLDKSITDPYTTFTCSGGSTYGMTFPSGSASDYLKNIDDPRLFSYTTLAMMENYIYPGRQFSSTDLLANGVYTTNFDHFSNQLEFTNTMLENSQSGDVVFSPFAHVIDESNIYF
jgi:hypothetical protein